MPSPFEELLNDLAAVQAMRRPPSRDTASRSARHAAEAQRNRRMAQQRPLKKSAPLPDWNGLAARQDKIAADLERSRVQAQKDAIRAHLAVLQQAARAGRLSAHDAALMDVYRGQAAALGLEP